MRNGTSEKTRPGSDRFATENWEPGPPGPPVDQKTAKDAKASVSHLPPVNFVAFRPKHHRSFNGSRAGPP